jgi:hypothetical protein
MRFDLEAFGEIDAVARNAILSDSICLIGLLFFAGKEDKEETEQE